MKAISLPQPWAHLVCAGIKDIDNRNVKCQYTGKVLIHAGKRPMPADFLNQQYFERATTIHNAQVHGWIPWSEDLSYGAVIGYATLKACVQVSDSIWADPQAAWKWELEDARLFDTPITGIKGGVNLFEIPDIDEQQLPKAHKVTVKAPQCKETELTLPLCEDFFKRTSEHPTNVVIELYVSPELIPLLNNAYDEETGLFRFRTLRIVHGRRERVYPIDSFWVEDVTEAVAPGGREEIVYYPNLNGFQEAMQTVCITLKDADNADK